jgi:hypothetical protein
MINKQVNVQENTVETGDVNGMFNRPKNENIPNFNKAAGERVVSNGNSYIVLGRDRPVGPSSGYGGLGSSRASAIDLVVGRQGSNPDGDRFVENNFGTLLYNKKPGDAARIYISQRADIDEYFGLRGGSQGMSKAKSAIGMIADDVRMIARRGIKLVTGGPKQTDSLGLDTNGIFGIDLIAGNLDIQNKQGKKYLQPMVKGDNLVEAIEEIVEQIKSLNSIFTEFALRQQSINARLIVGPYTGVGNMMAPIAVSLLGLNPAVPPNPIGVQLLSDNTMLTADVMVPLATQRNVELNSIKLDYLLSSGADYICSRYNRTN